MTPLIVDRFGVCSLLRVANRAGVAYSFRVDNDVLDDVISHSWLLVKRRNSCKYDLFSRSLSMSLHRYVLHLCGELFESCHVHHIDGGFVDCCRSNLVAVSSREHFIIHNAFSGRSPLAGLAPHTKPKKGHMLWRLGIYRAGGLEQFLCIDADGVLNRLPFVVGDGFSQGVL